MGGNNVKTVSDTQTEGPTDPPSPALYKPHHSPATSPTRDNFHTPLGSPVPGPTPEDAEPFPGDPNSTNKHPRSDGGWHAPFGRALTRIHRASHSLDDMNSQLVTLLSPGANTEGPRILDSAVGWGARLGEVRNDLRAGLRELGNLKDQYEARSIGEMKRTEDERWRDRQIEKERQEWKRETDSLRTELQKRDEIIREISDHVRALETRRLPREESAEKQRMQDYIHQLETEKEKLTENIREMQGEVQDLTLLQADLRTAVSVAERFRAEAQEKLETAERENQKLRAKGLPSPTLYTFSDPDPLYLLGPLIPSQTPYIPSNPSIPSLTPVYPLSKLLILSLSRENLTEDSGSFFRRYGGSKRGVFLRWAQDRTCGYKHVVITNFSTSWVDGMALCALLHSYLQDSIPYSQLRPLEKRKNLQLAFQVAESVGIPALLTPDHMLQTQGPDWQKVLLYVESIYQKFEA
ncbi:uncharacterized protein O3C94_019230 [Discoglossus pictus]